MVMTVTRMKPVDFTTFKIEGQLFTLRMEPPGILRRLILMMGGIQVVKSVKRSAYVTEDAPDMELEMDRAFDTSEVELDFLTVMSKKAHEVYKDK